MFVLYGIKPLHNGQFYMMASISKVALFRRLCIHDLLGGITNRMAFYVWALVFSGKIAHREDYEYK